MTAGDGTISEDQTPNPNCSTKKPGIPENNLQILKPLRKIADWRPDDSLHASVTQSNTIDFPQRNCEFQVTLPASTGPFSRTDTPLPCQFLVEITPAENEIRAICRKIQ